jgi:hypothetical protein
VNFPGLFHAWGRQVIAGYGWQLVERCVRESGGTLPDFSEIPDRHWKHQVKVDRALYTMLCDELVTESGADILFHTMPATVEAQEHGWCLTICGKDGLETFETACLVDCTGDANLVDLAGGKLRVAPSEDAQPATQVCRVSGYDLAELDLGRIDAAFQEAVKRGELSPFDGGWGGDPPKISGWLRKHGENANHIPLEKPAHCSEGRSRLTLAGRRSVLRVYRFLRRQPGLESLQIDYLAPECGVRETVTIVGDVTVTVEDYESGRIWSDALCYSFYPIDLHTTKGSGLQKRELDEGVVPTVPRGALLPQGLDRLIVAGRAVSSDREANSAVRVQASSMGMGQAAGAMAALTVQQGLPPRELRIDAIRELLEEHGAVVPIPEASGAAGFAVASQS